MNASTLTGGQNPYPTPYHGLSRRPAFRTPKRSVNAPKRGVYLESSMSLAADPLIVSKRCVRAGDSRYACGIEGF